MLIEIAVGLVIAGIVLLVVGILIARQYTLRAKLLTAFMFIVLASLGLLAAIDHYMMSRSLSEGASRVLLAAVRQKAETVDDFIRSTSSSIMTQAQLPVFANYLGTLDDPKQGGTTGEQSLFREVLKNLDALRRHDSKYIKTYVLLDSAGRIRAISGQESVTATQLATVLSGSAYRYTDVDISPVMFNDSGEAVLHFYAPVAGQAAAGTLLAVYSADILQTLVDNTHPTGMASFPILLDENNLRLVHGRNQNLNYTLAEWLNEVRYHELIGQQRIPPESERLFIEQASLIDRLDKIHFNEPFVESTLYGLGDEVYSAAVAELNSVPWKLVYAQPRSVMMEPVQEQTRIALLLAGGVGLIVVLLVMSATHVLMLPVRRLTRVVNQIRDGEFKVKAEIDTNDEVGGLAKAFNNMTDNINGLIMDLENEASQHKLTADNLRKLSQAIEQSPVSVMITDLNGDIEYINPEFSRVTGYTAEEVMGRNPRFLKSGHTPNSQFVSMWNSITTGQSWSGELYNKKKNGDLFWENVTISPVKSADGKVTHYLAIKEDITLRKDYERQLMYQASYDKLTDLPNRTLAFDRLKQALANAIRDQARLAVMYIDFDHFKNINDTLGHTAGDKFLVSMAERLKGVVRDVDTVARLGGDEFLLILAGSHRNMQAQPIEEYQSLITAKAADVLERVARPCVVEDMEFSVTASIGIAIFPEDGDDPHLLLKNADTAMYRGKRKGRNTFEIFTTEMSDKIVKRVEIETKLRKAYEDEKFFLKYQSLVTAGELRLVGAEALLRWEDDELGRVPPEVFVPFAEESGLIVDIGYWTIDRVCHDIKRMKRDLEVNDIYVAVNLSGRQFRGKGIARAIEDILRKHDLDGSCLELEITERLLMKDVPDVITTLNQFKEMGIRLSIDDFGTGYSSLSYLKRFPFDVLKIDRAFVQDISSDADDAALCEAIISMARSLGLQVIAEGVETEEQFEFLRSRGADILQGFYICKPLRYDDFKQFTTVSDWIASTA